MKATFCIVFVAVLGAALADGPRDLLRQYSNACKAESGVSDEVLTKVRNGEEVKEDSKLQEHGLCILKKAGFIDAKGQLQIETIRTKVNKHTPNKTEQVEEFITNCAVQKATPQETSSHFWTCLHEETGAARAH